MNVFIEINAKQKQTALFDNDYEEIYTINFDYA